MLRCIFVPNLEIVTSIGGELWHGQAQNGVNFDFEVKSVLEGQGQSPHKTIGILTKAFISDYRTHGRTDTQTDAGNDNTRRPKLASGKKWSSIFEINTRNFIMFKHRLKEDGQGMINNRVSYLTRRFT